MAIGCLGNYGSLEASDITTAIASQPTSTQTVKCSLRVKIKVEFPNGKTGGFSLYKDTDNKPDPQTIPFTVEGISSPKIVMEIDDSCYKYAGSGNIKVITLKDNSKVDDGQAPQFNVKVSGGSEGLDNAIDSEVDPGKKYELELDDTRDKQSYNITITAKDIDSSTVLKEYKVGTIKFSVAGE